MNGGLMFAQLFLLVEGRGVHIMLTNDTATIIR